MGDPRHKVIDIYSISLRPLEFGSDETAANIVNVLGLLPYLFAVEFEANWASSHNLNYKFWSRYHIFLDRRIANGFRLDYMQLCSWCRS